MARPGEAEKSLGRGIDVSLAAGENGFYSVWSTPNGILLSAPSNAGLKAISAADFRALSPSQAAGRLSPGRRVKIRVNSAAAR